MDNSKDQLKTSQDLNRTTPNKLPGTEPPSPNHFDAFDKECKENSSSNKTLKQSAKSKLGKKDSIHKHNNKQSSRISKLPKHEHENNNINYFSMVRLPLKPTITDIVNCLHFAGMPLDLLGRSAKLLEKTLEEGKCSTCITEPFHKYIIKMDSKRLITVQKLCFIPQKGSSKNA